MKKLKLGEILDFTGQPIDTKREADGAPIYLDLKMCIILQLAQWDVKSSKDPGKDWLHAIKIGQKVNEGNGEVLLEDAEWEFIREAVKTQPAYKGALVMGRIWEFLEGAEDVQVAPIHKMEVLS